MSYVWEQRKAEELCSISTGKSNTQDQIDDGKYPFYIRSDIPVRSDKYLYDCEAVITIGDGNIGKVFHYVKGKFDLHQRCYKMTDFNGILGKYYYYFFSTNFYERAMRMTAKGTVDSVRLDMISKMDIKMPKKISEQKKIADCLTKLDNLITLHQRKILLYKYFLTIVWEQRKLGKIFVSMQNNTLSRADLSYDSGVAMNVHYGDILVKFGEVLDIKSERLPMIVDETVLDKYKSSFLKNGDIIIADTAEDETVGKCTEIAGLSDEYVISGLHTIPYRPLQKFAFGYLGYYMNSTSYHNQLLPLMQGIKVTSISKVSLQNTVIIYPKSKVEQAAIGKYFYNLDNLITLHQWECIISRKNMVNAWEQRKLEDEVFSIDTGKSKFTSHESGKFEILGSTSVIGYDDSYDYEGDFLLTARVGANAGELYRHFGKVKISDNTVFIQGKYLDFIYYLLLNFGIKKLSFGTGQPLVKASELRKLNILMPINDNEREQIGLYLSKLDNLITLHQWECIVCTKIKVNTSIQCKFIKIGVKLQKCILLSIILLFEPRNIRFVFYVNILLRFIKVIELEVELIFVIIDGTIMFYLKIRCLYLNIFYTFIFKINK